ncbi:Protein of unknown function, partial [Gryllus bimaculatus]
MRMTSAVQMKVLVMMMMTVNQFLVYGLKRLWLLKPLQEARYLQQLAKVQMVLGNRHLREMVPLFQKRENLM